MQQPSTLLLLFFSLFICLVTISDVITQPPLDYQEEGIDSVILEMESIGYCPWSRSKSGDCSSEISIEIAASSKTAEKEGLNYYYFVNAGKIIGGGSKVTWDFPNAKIGNYSITVGVGKNGIIKGKTITKSFSIKECDCCLAPCNCPSSIIVTNPKEQAKAGDTLVFTANVVGGSQGDPTFNWMVTEGEIVKGQGTSTIPVKTTKEMRGHTITATVEVGGLCVSCPNTASASVEIKDK